MEDVVCYGTQNNIGCDVCPMFKTCISDKPKEEYDYCKECDTVFHIHDHCNCTHSFYQEELEEVEE